MRGIMAEKTIAGTTGAPPYKRGISGAALLCALYAFFAVGCSPPSSVLPPGDPEAEAPSPCDEVECAFGACRSLDNRAYCDCPEDYHRVGYIHCVPNNTDGDVDDEADGDPDVDLTDAATEKVTRTFSHYMDTGNSSLRPGETRVTAGDTGYGSPFINYAVNDRWVVYCTWDSDIIACEVSTGICWHYDLLESEDDGGFPTLVNDTLYARAFIDVVINNESTVRRALVQLNLQTMDVNLNVDTYQYIQAYGEYVVWSSDGWHVTLYHPLTHEISQLEESLNGTSVYPDIWNQTVVWQQLRGDEFCDIWTYDIPSEVTRRLDTGYSSMKCNPNIYGQHVAFIDDCVNLANRTGEERLVVYNLADDTWETLLPETGPKDRPDIDRDKVVWTDLRRGGRSSGGEYVNPDVYLYNLTKKQEVPIAVLDGWQFYPRISGRWVVYADSRFDRQDDAPVKIYDLILFDLCSLELYKNEDWCR